MRITWGIKHGRSYTGSYMARVRLTTGRIRDFTTDKGQAFLWDIDVPGLAVRATRSGVQAYIFQTLLNGRDIRMTIGDVRAWQLDRAREEARRLRTLIDQGIDPRLEKQDRIAEGEARRQEAVQQDVTVAEAWAAYIAARKHAWSELHHRDHYRMTHQGGEPYKRGKGITEPGPLASLMSIKLSDLTPAMVEAWLKDQTAHRPTMTALAYRLLRAFIRWANEHADYAKVTNPLATSAKDVKSHVPKAKAKEGDVLQREQLRPWFESVRKIGNPVISAYLQTLLLTGARREELAGLTWEDVDFQWKSITIHDKVEGERTIPMTPYVAALLAPLPRRNGWVFSSPTAASGRLQEPRIQHVKALEVAGLPHVSLHGLRRSFGTLAEWIECPVGVVAQIQGHKPSAIAEKHYRRRPLDLLRMWHVRIEAWILEQAGVAQPADEEQGLRLVKRG